MQALDIARASLQSISHEIQKGLAVAASREKHVKDVICALDEELPDTSQMSSTSIKRFETLNFGGAKFTSRGYADLTSPQPNLFSTLLSGRWGHLLGKDRSSKRFLDLDLDWFEPIFANEGHESSWSWTRPQVAPEHRLGFETVLSLFRLEMFFLLLPRGFEEESSIACLRDPYSLRQLEEILRPSLPAIGRSSVRLLYRGSRDGFTAATFHSKCDGKSNTVCVIEDSDGNVFGGFADRPWHCSLDTRDFVKSTSSCLFCLRLASVEGRTEAARFDLLPAGSLFGLAHHYRALCIFGDKALCIYDQCNDNEESSTCLRRTYSHNGCGAHALTGGKENFRVKEVEVYEVVDPALSFTDLVAATCGGGGGGGCGGGDDAVHWREQWMHTSNKASAAAVTVSIGSADSGARIAHALSAEGPLGS